MNGFCRRMIARSPDCIVAWYLMASYLYYHEDRSLLTDSLFDDLCAQLLKRWKHIQHPHKKLIDRASLRAGTGYAIKEQDYPRMCVGAANRLLEYELPTYHPKRKVNKREKQRAS